MIIDLLSAIGNWTERFAAKAVAVPSFRSSQTLAAVSDCKPIGSGRSRATQDQVGEELGWSDFTFPTLDRVYRRASRMGRGTLLVARVFWMMLC